MKLSGAEHIEIQLLAERPRRWWRPSRPASLRLTLEFASQYEAGIAFNDASTSLKSGIFVLRVKSNDQVARKGPKP